MPSPKASRLPFIRRRRMASLPVFRLMFQNHSAIMLIIEPQTGLILDANLAAVDFYGYPKSELCGMHIQEINTLPPDQVQAELQLALEEKRNYFVFLHRLASGETRSVEIHSSPIPLHDRQLLFSIIHDNTVRKQAEQALRETNAYLENLINHANAPIIVWDTQFRITRFNHAFEFLTGFTEAEVLGQSLEILFPPKHAAASMALIHKTLTGERWETVEIAIQHRDKSVRTVLWNSATLFTSDGQTPLATIAQGQDITDRKTAEAALHKSEERYRMLFNNMTEGFALHELIFDANGTPYDYRFIDFNQAFEQLTGLKRENTIGRGQSEVLPQEDPIWFNTYCKVALTGKSIRMENYSPSLQRYYEVYAYCPGKNQFAVVFTDISERKQAEANLVKSKALLSETEKTGKIGGWEFDVETPGPILDRRNLPHP